jgi:hypothetical protein
MKAYKALIALDLKLALRNRSVIFFNYLFPLIFFFIFGQAMHAERGAAMTIVIAMVLIIGILGNGLFGAGIRAVQEREANILRRYKVTPITPAPLLFASVVTGWILYMPNVILIFTLAHFLYGMPWPQSMASILIFITLAIVGFRCYRLNPGFRRQLHAGKPASGPVDLSPHAVLERCDLSALHVPALASGGDPVCARNLHGDWHTRHASAA